MNDERVFQLLMETNPVPDPDALDSPLALAPLERRSPTMATDTQSTTQPIGTQPVREKYWRSRLLIGAAAVLALIVGIGIWVGTGGDEEAAVSPEVDIVLSAMDARNRGDIEAYKASLTGSELAFEESVRLAEALSYANSTTELADCAVVGNAPTGESIVQCEATTTDDFYGAGGISVSETITFQVTADGKISASESELDNIPWERTELAEFNLAFWSWLMKDHLTVFEEISYPNDLLAIPGLTFDFSDPHDPAEMGIAVQYVDEFVAQSDVYPLSQ